MRKNLILNVWFALLLLLCIFKPYGITYFSVDLDIIWKFFLIIIAVFISAVYIQCYKADKFILTNVIYFAFIIGVTSIKSTNIEYCFSKILPAWTIFFYSIMYIKYKPNDYLKVLYYFSIFIIFANLIYIYKFPNGLGGENYYFLGLDNMSALNLVLGGFFIWLYRMKKNKNKIITFILVFLIFYQLNYTDCSTGKVGAAFLVMFYLFFELIKKIKYLNFKNFYIISLILFFVIVVFRLQNIFSYIIVNILHRDLTFTTRTQIWDNVIDNIKLNFIFGIGYSLTHAHSTYLDIIYKSGIIGFFIYNFVIITIIKKLNIEEKLHNNYIVFILSLASFVYFIMTVIEVYQDNQFFYCLLVLLYYSEFLEEKDKDGIFK